MDLRFSKADEDFRQQVRRWLDEHLVGPFAALRGKGGPGEEHEAFAERHAWEKVLGAAGFSCLGWPRQYGGRGATLTEQVVWNEEYARADAPARVGLIGEGLLGPTLIAFGTEEQKRRFLPPIVRGEELWCQGYSEPGAGSDLANVQTRAALDGDEWVLHGQKVWTSLAHWADFCFVLCRTGPGPGPGNGPAAPRHKGISCLLVPMRQPGITIRPITQLTGTSEFSEVFFDGARTHASHIVGAPGEGWRVAMGTLAFERGTFTLGQQIGFERELGAVMDVARDNGRGKDPVLRQRLVQAWIELRVMRYNALRTLSNLQGGQPGPEASITKLYWGTWHRKLGELAMDVLGPAAEIYDRGAARFAITAGGTCGSVELGRLQRLFLFSRADTIYAGSNEIQRNIIAERVLGLPQEPRGEGQGRGKP